MVLAKESSSVVREKSVRERIRIHLQHEIWQIPFRRFPPTPLRLCHLHSFILLVRFAFGGHVASRVAASGAESRQPSKSGVCPGGNEIRVGEYGHGSVHLLPCPVISTRDRTRVRARGLTTDCRDYPSLAVA